MKDDDQSSVKIRNISFLGTGISVSGLSRSLVTEGFLTLFDFGHGLFKYRHDITEVYWRMVR